VVFETVEDKYGTLVVELLQVIDWCLQDVSPRPAKRSHIICHTTLSTEYIDINERKG
jgi:hypothetical protein